MTRSSVSHFTLRAVFQRVRWAEPVRVHQDDRFGWSFQPTWAVSNGDWWLAERGLASGGHDRRRPEADPAHRRRRSGRLARRRSRSPPPLRRRLSGGTYRIRPPGARDAARAEASWRSGGRAARRPPDARHERARVPRRGDGSLSSRPPCPAHRVRRHRRRHSGDQRRRPRPLPTQAVGPARREAVPGGRLAHRDVARQRRGAGQPHPGRGAPLVGAFVRGA